jgi:serine/threonine protein kinase
MARGIDMEDPHMSTNYVQTRWYRAPEMLLDHSTVTTAIDMWSIGCVFAEMIGRRVLFPGKSPADQVELLVKTLGTPKDMSKVPGSQNGIRYLKSLMTYPGKNLADMFPGANPDAICLLSKMLVINPDDRINALDAMRHPYFKSRKLNTFYILTGQSIL